MEIVRRSVREQVLEVLRKAILDHTYPLGSRINLDELKRSLGVSNTPLREAISILEGEGLVEYRQNAGVFVVSMLLSLTLPKKVDLKDIDALTAETLEKK